MSPAARDDLVGRLVDGRYRVDRHLADGGMGSVYAAIDERLERDVALKVMRDDLARDPAFVERFRKEARSAARLSHPNVVAVYDQGRDGDLVFLVMELVEGTTLRGRLDDGPLEVGAALDIADDILSALAAAHRAGIIHRDVTPQNVLIGADGVVKVADFGLARAASGHTMTSTGSVFGTVGYLAPEQVERGIADARSDVYSAGLVLHEMLTGRPAVTGDSPIHVAYQHVHVDVPPPSVVATGLPTELDDLLGPPTRRNPDERPRDASTFLDDVRATRGALTADLLAVRADPAPNEPDSDGASGSEPDAEQSTPHATTGRLWRSTHVIPARVAAGTSTAAVRPRRRPTRRALVTAGLCFLAALALVWFVAFGPVSARAIPDVTRRPQSEAVVTLDATGVRPQVQQQFSETVPAGTVVSTDPAPGTEVWRWAAVALVVSKGPERYAVPSLAGRTPTDAGRALTGAHLRLGRTTEAYHDSVPAGQVISSTPASGTLLRPDAPVDLTVSTGPRPVPLVDWTSRPVDDARAELEPLGVIVKIGGRRFSNDVAKGSVIEQQPGATTLHRGDVVTFTVSKGPDLVTVPSVQGRTEEEARKALQAAGFTVEVDRIAGGLFGTAHSTKPEADSQAPRGSVVVLRIV